MRGVNLPLFVAQIPKKPVLVLLDRKSERTPQIFFQVNSPWVVLLVPGGKHV